ncbi:MAG TPA: murein biosynthesis integral membrane protein MurJ, partial [Terriglobales bacterium]|nr:murein biosynthesis integral membrane protein MurJ [Terriglobales bacterium]
MSENRQIARAAGLVGIFTLLSRVGGLMRDAVMGYYFGTGAAADAFFVAFRIPNLLRRFVAEGTMSIALIPVFSDYAAKRSRQETNEAMSVVGTLMMSIVGVLTLAGVWWAEELTRLFAPGFADDAAKLELTVRLTRLVFPYIFLVSLVAFLSGILNALRHFAAPAMSPVLLNLAIIVAALLSPWFEQPILVVAWGVIAGGVLQVALQLPPIAQRGIRLRPQLDLRHEAVRRSLWLMLPTLFGAAVYQINILVSTIFASLLPSGSISYLWYADRINEFPLGIFAVALGTAALPTLSAQAARGAYDELWQSLAFSIRLNTFINLPALVGIFVLAEPITSVLFVRGAFGPGEAELTARAVRMAVLGLWSISMVRLLAPAFYALGNTKAPVVAAAIAFVANIVAALALMGPVPA